MDSITQIVLGAAMGEVTMGKKIGNKAQLFGAIAGTLPDLDVFLTKFVDDDLAYLTIHRSYSHSGFVLFLLAFPLAWLTYKGFKQKFSYWNWYSLWALALVTHPILDCGTTYGTQFLLPFTNYLVGFNNVSVVDPLYTLPFLFILGACLFIKKENPLRLKVARWSLIVSCSYMLLTFVNKWNAHQHFEKALQTQQINYDKLSTTPTMFNNILWAGIAYNQDSIFVGEYSLLQKNDAIKFYGFARGLAYEKEYEGRVINTLKWFGQEKYFIEKDEKEDQLNFYIIKWGRANYLGKTPKEAFQFYSKVYKDKTSGQIKIERVEPDFENMNMKVAFADFWERIMGRRQG